MGTANSLEEARLSDFVRIIPELAEIQRVHDWLTQWRWSEASGGNFSIRMDTLPEAVHNLSGETPKPLPLNVPSLGGAYLLISARNSRARDIALEPEVGVGLFWILQSGEEFTCLWGNNDPTSELLVHLAIHNAQYQSHSNHNAVLHSHPSNLIALTHNTEFDNHIDLGDILLRMQSEARVHLPEGIRHLPYHIPGSRELGDATATALLKSPVLLWKLHGAISTGKTLSDALDYLEIVDKAAQIYWILMSSGIKPEGLTDADLERSLRHFRIWERYRGSLE
jgi:rhamnulose-1-phosphate aldolase